MVTMEEVYYDPRHAGSFAGIKTLSRYSGASSGKVKSFLSTQDAYTLHKYLKRKFPRRKTFSKGINDVFQADLCDLQNLSKYNDGYRYILTCLCVFSKYAFAIPLKDKRGSTVAVAFETIFNERTPNFLHTDAGTEFKAHEVQSLLKRYDVKHYHTFNSETKASVVERFNRTIKTRIYRFLTFKNTKRWVDVLEDLVYSYNRTRHSSIGVAPIEVTASNENDIANKLYPPRASPPKWLYKPGDLVRISVYKQIFEKGYLPNWSQELFKIRTRLPTDPVQYEICDLNGDAVSGKFYEAELQKVTKTDDIFKVEKVLKTRKRKGKVEYFVKWLGYPEKFNSWTFDVFSAA
jgi:transposase InsO family protein